MAEQMQLRLTEQIEQRVAEIMASDAVQESLMNRLQAERAVLEQQVPLVLATLPAGWAGIGYGTRVQAGQKQQHSLEHAGVRIASPGVTWLWVCAHRTCLVQVEQELFQERLLAEQEELKAKRAIQQQQKELQDIEQQRQNEVIPLTAS